MKETKQEDIFEEHEEFLGEKVQPNKESSPEIVDFSTMEANLLQPTGESSYEDWVNTAIRGMETWNQQKEQPLEDMDFEEREERVLHLIDERPISFSTESALFSFNLKGVSRAIATQLVRHRDNVYSQESFRVSYSGNNDFRAPESVLHNERSDADLDEDERESIAVRLQKLTNEVHDIYNSLIDAGIPTEQARQVIPLGTTTSVNVTFTLSHFAKYLNARTHDIAQEEHTVMATLMVLELTEESKDFYKALRTQIDESIIEEIIRVGREYDWIRDRYEKSFNYIIFMEDDE